MKDGFVEKKITSSISDLIGYKAETFQMRIVFKNSSMYEYDDIPEADYISVDTAESAGKRLKEIIKGKAFRPILKTPDDPDFKRHE